MRRSSRVLATTLTLVALLLSMVVGSLATAAPDAGAPQRLGLQQVTKHPAAKTASAFSNAKGANPFISLLSDPSASDYAYWKSAMRQQSAKRAAKRAAERRALAPEPLLVDEAEPDGVRGGNDTPA